MHSARAIPFALLALLLSLSGPISALQAQDSTDYGDGSSLDLGVSGVGISFGSSPRWTGLRFNWSDKYLERIDGVNVTLWKPGKAVGGSVNGVALGLGPAAGHLRGFSFGLLGVLPEQAAYGVTIGGLGVVAGGSLTGLNFGGLGLITEGGAHGINFGGLGLISEGTVAGFNFGGLGLISEGGAYGVNLAGLGLISEGTVAGINLAGLGIVSERGIDGINGALLGVVTEHGLRGITVTGLGAVAEGDITGATIGGLGVVSDGAIQGLAAALVKVDTRDLHGVSIAGWTHVRNEQHGLSIALFNQAEELHGVQLGLLNFAGNNHGLARWTPIINLHLN